MYIFVFLDLYICRKDVGFGDHQFFFAIEVKVKCFSPVDFCGALVQWSVCAPIPFHSNLSQTKKTLVDLCMGFCQTLLSY